MFRNVWAGVGHDLGHLGGTFGRLFGFCLRHYLEEIGRAVALACQTPNDRFAVRLRLVFSFSWTMHTYRIPVFYIPVSVNLNMVNFPDSQPSSEIVIACYFRLLSSVISCFFVFDLYDRLCLYTTSGCMLILIRI